jgi:hypothetical protein
MNDEDATLSNGKKGAGLFRYLRTLIISNGDDRRNVIATVFKGVDSLGKQASLPRGAPPVTCVLDSLCCQAGSRPCEMGAVCCDRGSMTCQMGARHCEMGSRNCEQEYFSCEIGSVHCKRSSLPSESPAMVCGGEDFSCKASFVGGEESSSRCERAPGSFVHCAVAVSRLVTLRKRWQD